MRRSLLALASVAVLAVFLPAPASGGGGALPIEYTVSCQYGQRVVAWTLTNNLFGPDDDITVEWFTLVLDPDGPEPETTEFEPQPIPRWSSAKAATTLPGYWTGEIRGSIHVRAIESGSEAQEQVPTVTLAQPCPGFAAEPPTSTTSEPAVAGVDVAAPAGDAASRPRFTG